MLNSLTLTLSAIPQITMSIIVLISIILLVRDIAYYGVNKIKKAEKSIRFQTTNDRKPVLKEEKEETQIEGLAGTL